MSADTTQSGIPTFGVAFEQLEELQEQVIAAARRAGKVYLDSYEDAVDRTIELELKLAGLSQQEWLKDLIEAQATFAKELTDSYTAALRSVL